MDREDQVDEAYGFTSDVLGFVVRGLFKIVFYRIEDAVDELCSFKVEKRRAISRASFMTTVLGVSSKRNS
jgi:hypothetical protein